MSRPRRGTRPRIGTAPAAERPGPHALATGSGAPRHGPRSLEEVVGAQVRQARRRLDLTLAALAEAAGLSHGMLSKIENGRVSPSLATLQALAAALNLPLTALFSAYEERRDCSLVRRGQGVSIERRGTKAGHRYQLLGHALSGEVTVEPYLITLAPDAVPYGSFQHAGVEIIHMLTGRVVYRHADDAHELEPGDTLFFDATAPHGPERLPELPATYLSIIIYPKAD